MKSSIIYTGAANNSPPLFFAHYYPKIMLLLFGVEPETDVSVIPAQLLHLGKKMGQGADVSRSIGIQPKK